LKRKWSRTAGGGTGLVKFSSLLAADITRNRHQEHRVMLNARRGLGVLLSHTQKSNGKKDKRGVGEFLPRYGRLSDAKKGERA